MIKRKDILERETCPVEVFIRTKDNPLGLNALLWSLFPQKPAPELLTILNTGEMISQESVLYALSLFKEFRVINVPNERYLDKDNHFNHSLQFIDIVNFFDRELIWFFDDDCIIPSNAMQSLLKKIPSMPTFLVDYEPLEFEEIDDVVIHGLLAEKKDWKKAIERLKEKNYPKMGEDAVINKIIKPLICKDIILAHTRRHGSFHDCVYYELHNQLWK